MQRCNYGAEKQGKYQKKNYKSVIMVTCWTRNHWLFQIVVHLGQIVLTGNVLQRARNRLAAIRQMGVKSC
jgi:hypothetical protein